MSSGRVKVIVQTPESFLTEPSVRPTRITRDCGTRIEIVGCASAPQYTLTTYDCAGRLPRTALAPGQA
jgi:hypothetical protein